MNKIKIMILALVLGLTTSVQAEPIIGEASGLCKATTLVTFDEVVLTELTEIGQAYEELGVSFSEGVAYNVSTHMPAGPNLSEPDALNMTGSGLWVIKFHPPVKEVSFAYASDLTVTTFIAKRRGKVVEQFESITDFGSNVVDNIFGFRDVLIDEVVIEVDTSAYLVGNAIDNLAFSTRRHPKGCVSYRGKKHESE